MPRLMDLGAVGREIGAVLGAKGRREVKSGRIGHKDGGNGAPHDSQRAACAASYS